MTCGTRNACAKPLEEIMRDEFLACGKKHAMGGNFLEFGGKFTWLCVDQPKQRKK